MPTGSYDVRKLADAILTKPKALVGIGEWQGEQAGCKRFTREVECEGEIVASICVKSWPNRPQPCFRISLIFMGIAIWRVDFLDWDPAHVNPDGGKDGLPSGPISEPHYHAWTDNRRFATQNSLPKKLKNARLMPNSVRNFDNAFRWFCGQTEIEIGRDDLPNLPNRDTLL